MIERSVRFKDEDYEKLREISERENLPISYLVRISIAQFINGYEGSIKLVESENKS